MVQAGDWCVDLDCRMGQLGTRQIAAAVGEGWLDPGVRVWREGRPWWLPIRQIDELVTAVARYRQEGRSAALRSTPLGEHGVHEVLSAVIDESSRCGPTGGRANGVGLGRCAFVQRSLHSGRSGRRTGSPRFWDGRRRAPSRWALPVFQLLVGLCLGVLLALGALYAQPPPGGTSDHSLAPSTARGGSAMAAIATYRWHTAEGQLR